MDAAASIPSNVGTYLARRLVEVGIGHYFTVPGTTMRGEGSENSRDEESS